MLTVIEYNGNGKWKCLCDCGNRTVVKTNKLTSLQTKSCGCLNYASGRRKQFIDITGNTYSYLTVKCFEERKGRIDYWRCVCSCGNEVVRQTNQLTRNGVHSCGCMLGEKNRLNLIGHTFGHLTVKEMAFIKNKRTYWKCLCDCGKECIVSSKTLMNGTCVSCGHIKRNVRKDITGKKFGFLTVIKNEGNAKWSCLCDCGNYTVVSGYALKCGNTASCGCKHYPENDTRELANKYNMHKSYIGNVKKYLFGEYIPVLSENQKHELDKYLKLSKQKNSSKDEREISAFIKSIYSDKVYSRLRNVINPFELDVYVPAKNLAIEYNGLYFHSTKKNKRAGFHLMKTEMCNKQGIRLIHVFEDEWRDKKDIVKSLIKSALGVYERKIYARNCQVREVTDKETVKNLFDENHVQGAVNRYELCLGLYHKEELVQACVFGKQHFGRNGDIELYRMVTLKNTQVLGGFSKIMKHCPYDKVVSYVSRRLFDAKGYFSSGWKCVGKSVPSFWITDFKKRYSRHLFKKQQCLKMFDNVTPDMTEQEMQELNGFYRIYDCGTYKVVWDRSLIENKK